MKTPQADFMIASKDVLAKHGWNTFLDFVEKGEPELKEEIEMVFLAMTQADPIDRDRIWFEIGFRLALHYLEQGIICPLGSNN
jgi:uncharacterized protein YifE (UPF0438 family)